MLVLSRTVNEKIILSNTMGVIAEITVVDIRGDKVRLGIDAGKTVTIHREEVQNAIARQENSTENG